MDKNKRVLTCRYAFAHLITYICLKCNHKITKDDCEECKDYSNKYYMTKEKTMQYKEQNDGNKRTED